MTIRYSINVVGADSDNPFSNTASARTNLQRFINVLKSLASGTKSGVYTIDVHASATRASATATCASVANADTVTINGTAFTATQFNASGTVTAATALALDTVTVQGVVLTAVSGTPVAGGTTFDISGSDTATATSLAAAINANPTLAYYVTATSSAAIVTIRALASGTGGNALTLATSNNTRLAKSGTVLAGGAAVVNNQFDYKGSNTQTAAALAAAINASTTAAVKSIVTATSALGVVTVTCKTPGLIGNCVTFVSSNGTRLAVTGSGVLASGAETLLSVMSF